MSRSKPTLVPGAYEALITNTLSQALEQQSAEPLLLKLDEAESAGRLAHHLASVIESALESLPSAGRLDAQVDIANKVLQWLAERGHADSQAAVEVPVHILRQVSEKLLSGQTPPP